MGVIEGSGLGLGDGTVVRVIRGAGVGELVLVGSAKSLAGSAPAEQAVIVTTMRIVAAAWKAGFVFIPFRLRSREAGFLLYRGGKRESE